MSARGQRLRIACVVPFLDEEAHMPAFLSSLERQRRFPDELVLVDDGSRDRSPELAGAFAARRSGVRLLRRPPRPPERDRLLRAPELRAFQRGLEALAETFAIAVKLDADLELGPDLFAVLERAFLCDPELGIAGARLRVSDPRGGPPRHERCPPGHVRGATKFYRRACLEAISPLPAILGWDTIDEVAARRLGWRTRTVTDTGADSLHLRPTGAADGLLRAQYRWGACAWGIGQHPLWVGSSALRRLGERPPGLAGIAFAAGWAAAGIRGAPRARAEVRSFGRREQIARLRTEAVRTLLPRTWGKRTACA